MMNLNNHSIILASGSPRRHQFLKEMGIPFQVKLKPVDEVYPPELKGSEISDYLAKLKADAFEGSLEAGEILITSDTVVWHKGTSLAKAADAKEAFQMLRALSGDWHEVITSVCFSTPTTQKVVNQITQVKFRDLSDEEIQHYINTYKPYDKAGAYGIQEWIGLTGIEEIKGSYPNVVGLPTQLVYKTLIEMVK
ncbi:septum formation protein Maf [Zobellia amurskyensis]|uniref:dTTP/UTP pyrophosphatase n=1 Tax=Zobellia amurskyensis TaxID=248905 RepID=A0A7X2ZWS7_9FLAO|nr:Maf family nucleotide pyrophosphatase [Zobellia amurskyensis]MUH37847.1 septum formation protein Maf [Zobellia amurskyensis]